MDENSSNEDIEANERPPTGWQETLIANFRPQPAIPSAIVFFLSVLMPITTFGTAESVATDGGSVFLYLIPAGVLISCGLAVAAGFCSLFPQTMWLVLGVWGIDLVGRGSLPSYNSYVFQIGIFAVVVMFAIQVWRVSTGRFLPTIREDPERITY